MQVRLFFFRYLLVSLLNELQFRKTLIIFRVRSFLRVTKKLNEYLHRGLLRKSGKIIWEGGCVDWQY